MFWVFHACLAFLGPRLCIHLLLTSQWEQLVAFFAIVCSSYVPVNRHSTGRTLLTPLGNQHFIGVRRSNKMTSRTWHWVANIVHAWMCVHMQCFPLNSKGLCLVQDCDIDMDHYSLRRNVSHGKPSWEFSRLSSSVRMDA